MKRLIIGLAAFALAVSVNGAEMDRWYDDSIYTDTFIMGDCGMYWGDSMGKLFQTVLTDGMVLGTDFKYVQGTVPEVESISVTRLPYLDFSNAIAGFTFEDGELVTILRMIRVDDIGEVAIILTELNKMGSSCGFEGTQKDPVFKLYWNDRKKNYMSMTVEQIDSGYDVTLTMAESSYWAKLLERSRQNNE